MAQVILDMHEYEELKSKASMGEDFEILLRLLNKSIIEVEKLDIKGKVTVLEITNKRHDLANVYRWLFGKSRNVPHNVSFRIKWRESEEE